MNENIDIVNKCSERIFSLNTNNEDKNNDKDIDLDIVNNFQKGYPH